MAARSTSRSTSQDSDIPKVQDLGTEMAAIPALLYEFLRPNWSPGPFSETGANPNTGGCSRNPSVQDRGTGCPTADPAIRQAIAYAIDKNEINTRLLGGNAAVANTNISPSAWFYDPNSVATNFDPDKAKQILADGGWADSDGDGIVEKNGLKAKIELCTTTRQVRQDTLALISAWLKNVGIDSVINPVSPSDIFADYNEATNDIPVRPVAQQLRPCRACVRLLDRPARQLHELPQQPVPPDRRERCSGLGCRARQVPRRRQEQR